MAYYEFPLGTINNPLTDNLFFDNENYHVVAPGLPLLITTEDEKDILTESDEFITTEG